MASHIEGLGFPGQTTPLTTRLHERFARLVEAVKSRDEVRTSLPLASGERVLATTCDSGGSWVAASERALYHHVGDRSGLAVAWEWVRVGWEEIGNVYWNDRECTLTFTGLVPTVARRTVLHLPTGASLGLLAHERVAWTEVVRTEIQLSEHGKARVIGRRRPGSDELTWLVGLDGGSHTAGFQVALEAALNEVRRQMGV
jgi:hypothetical protein